MSNADAPSIWLWATAALALAHALLILTSPTPPLHDYPGHLARIHIMHSLGESEFLQRYYEYHWGLRHNMGTDLLIFALAQDLFWTGVGATLMMGLGTAATVAAIATVAVSARDVASRIAKTQAGIGMLAMRAIEVGAAALIVAFGALLLAGYMASERLWMFTG